VLHGSFNTLLGVLPSASLAMTIVAFIALASRLARPESKFVWKRIAPQKKTHDPDDWRR